MTNITPNTKVALSLVAFLSLAGSLLWTGWFANDMLHGIRDEIAGLRKEMAAQSRAQWTSRDMVDWAHEVERLNATRGLVFPDPRETQRRNRDEREK